MRSILCAAMVLVFGAGTALADQHEPFDAPEQMTWHAPSQSWFVSSLGGGVSLEKDGYGWVTRLDAAGKVVNPRWVKGLDAPTGMTAIGDRLFVADRGVVVEVDVPTARIVARHAVTGAEFVNDVTAAPNGDLYVSDFMGNRIYRLPAATRAAEVFVASDALDFPNGLVVDGDQLIVATWGPMTDPKTFATSRPGTVLTVDLATNAIKPLADGRPIANFDGIVKVGDVFCGTDWVGGRLLRIARDGTVTEVLTGFKQLADLGYRPDTGQLGLPEMSSSRVFLLTLDRRE